MNIHNHALIFVVTALLAAGCKKSSTEPVEPSPKPPPQTNTAPSSSLPNPTSLPLPPNHPPIGSTTTPPGAEQLTLVQIEENYRAATTLRGKIKAMRQLVMSEDKQAVLTAGRMFHEEKDAVMREEFLELLLDMPGKEVDKLSVLASAVTPDQPMAVRELAIDIMINLGSKNAIPVLETLLKDPNATIRDNAKDAIKEITNPTPPSAMTGKDAEDEEDE